MALYFITGSKNKFSEIQEIVGEVEQLELDLPEIQESDAYKIIAAKLEAARAQTKGSFIVEDTSLYFNALNGLPGPLIKWFLKSVGNEGLYKIAQSFGNSTAEAKTIIGYSEEDGAVEYFEGVLMGDIVFPRGGRNFGWDPVFQPKGSDKTFAEMTPEEKNSFSMRTIAAHKLREYLTGNK